eukprot:CAMPEP_0115881746 /NCGR_PEP_ID=MMETSP0287-20121206/28615_1 /TAXON_ID=412157 /ORGANISM="Chrysochromulina rotalis, Strain UIO044" /LENGTH=34 /DNA_ID= /DNA_START= /DNA_END= /DNA_ORIENTATION=
MLWRWARVVEEMLAAQEVAVDNSRGMPGAPNRAA